MADTEAVVPPADVQISSPRPSADDDPDAEYEPIPEDIYGFAIYQIVINWNEIQKGNIMREKSRAVNSFLGMFAGILMLWVNVTLQGLLLLFTKFYIVDPAQGEMSVNQIGFHHKYGDTWNMEVMQEALAHHEETAKIMCEAPSTDVRFLYVIVFCWVVVVMQDLRSSVEFSLTIFCLPTTQEGEHMLDDDDSAEGTVIKSVTLPVRLAVVFLVALPKFLIGVLLLHYGTLWLIATSGFMDLVLNAVALAFIVEFSALLFSTFLSANMQGKVQATQFKHTPSGGESSWSAILTQAWNGYMSCVIMLAISVGICYYYVNYQMHSVTSPKAEVNGFDLGKAMDAVETVNIADQVGIPCQRLVGAWWTTHNSAGVAYPWFTQHLKEVDSGGGGGGSSRRGRKKKSKPRVASDTTADVDDNALPKEGDDATSSTKGEPEFEHDKMHERDAIKDTIENPHKLLPQGQLRDNIRDTVSKAPKAPTHETAPSTKLTVEPVPHGAPPMPEARTPEVTRLQKAATGAAIAKVDGDFILMPHLASSPIAGPAPERLAELAVRSHLRSAKRHA